MSHRTPQFEITPEEWAEQFQFGGQVKFTDDRFWWDVKAVHPDFAILTRHAAFEPWWVKCYTIVSRVEGVRGPCNLIGQGYGDGSYSAEECARLLRELTEGEVIDGEDWGPRIEISHRNWLRVDVAAARAGIASRSEAIANEGNADV